MNETREEAATSNREKLGTALRALDPLVALFVGSQRNPPDCARELLQSFLVGGSTLESDEAISLIEKRKHTFPKMVITLADQTPEQQERLEDLLKSNRSQPLLAVAAADTQIGSIEFEPQVWNAPTKLHIERAFTPTSEFPASGPIHHDFYTHRDSWRKAIQQCIDTSAMPTPESDDAEYWRHELRAFDRAFGMLPPEFPASLKEQANVLAPQVDRRMRPRLVNAAVPCRLEDWMRQLVFAEMKERLALPSGDEARVGPDAVLSQLLEIDRTAMLKDPSARVRGGEYEHPVFGRVLVIGNHPHDGAARICETVIDDESFYFLTDRSTLTPADGESKWPYLGLSETSEKTLIANMRTNMLADTADEAQRIINDAGLLKNLAELFTMRDPGAEVTIAEVSGSSKPWTLSIMKPDGHDTRLYQSTSLHQVIAVAHKGEQDREYPEPQ